MSENRIYLYTKDVMLLTGKTDRTCEEKIKSIKLACGKNQKHPITIEEYCHYEMISEDEVRKALGLIKK